MVAFKFPDLTVAEVVSVATLVGFLVGIGIWIGRTETALDGLEGDEHRHQTHSITIDGECPSPTRNIGRTGNMSICEDTIVVTPSQ